MISLSLCMMTSRVPVFFSWCCILFTCISLYMWHVGIWSVFLICLYTVTVIVELFHVVLKLCTVISTLRWAVLTILWIGFCHTGPISLCIDSFVFMCKLYFVCFCFTLHSCIIVSMVGWTCWDWSLILRTYLPSVLWHGWLGHWPVKLSPIWPIMCLVGR